MFLLVCYFLFLFCFFPKTQKDQKHFCCFSLPFVCFGFLHLSCFICYRWFAIRKSKKILLCLLVSFCSCFQFENSKNICCSSLVCKVHYEFNGLWWLERGFHFILSKLHKWKGNNDDLRQSDCGERLVWTLFVFIFVHILIHVSMLSWFMWGICYLRKSSSSWSLMFSSNLLIWVACHGCLLALFYS